MQSLSAAYAAHSYGFVVYADASVTDVACAGLNGMRMGERTLTVRRATEVCLSLHRAWSGAVQYAHMLSSCLASVQTTRYLAAAGLQCGNARRCLSLPTRR